MKGLSYFGVLFITYVVLPTGNAYVPSARISLPYQKRSVEKSSSPRKPLSLQSTGTPIRVIEPIGKGLLEDINRKLPHYKSDFTDGFNIKSVSSTLFLFFACLAPAVAFGGLLGVATGGIQSYSFTVHQ
jgi:HCO3- transporter family